jgi:hypothetical protein
MNDLPKLIDLPPECFEKPKQCAICGRVLMSRKSFEDHLQGKHPEDYKKWMEFKPRKRRKVKINRLTRINAGGKK